MQNYREELLSLIPEEAITLLNDLVAKLDDLRSDRVETELNERIWEAHERVRKADVVGEKPVVIMRLQKELDRCRREKSIWAKRKRDLENQTLGALHSLTNPLIENLKTELTNKINSLMKMEFIDVVKRESKGGKGKVTVSTNVNQIAQAHALFRNAIDRLNQMYYCKGTNFTELTKGLTQKLDELNLQEGVLCEMTPEELESLEKRISDAKHPKLQEPVKSTIPGDAIEKAKQMEESLGAELRRIFNAQQD